MAFSRDPIADLEPAHFLAHFDNRADIFVADVHRHWNRLCGPLVPLPDVDVGTADGCLANLDQHIVRPD